MPNDQPDYTAVVNAQTMLINGVAVAQDGVTHDLGVVTVPNNTHTLELYWKTTTSFPTIKVVGQTTGFDWRILGVSHLSANGTSRFIIPMRQVLDGQVDIQFGFTNVGGNATVWVIAMTDASMVTVDSSQPGSVMIADPSGQSVVTTTLGKAGTEALDVTRRFSDAAYWEAPVAAALFNGTVALTTNIAIIPGIANTTIYLHWVTLSMDGSFGTGDWRVKDGSTDIGGGYSSTARGIVINKDFKGLPLGVGNSFNLFLAAGTAGGFAQCTADYQQV